MSLAGFKKQLNKTSQYLSEKVGGNKGSQLEEDYVDLERKIDVIQKCSEDMHLKTKEYLQPNPTARTKLAMQASLQKARGQAKSVRYPQAECVLGDVFLKGGNDLNEFSPYAQSLQECGQAFTQLSEHKDEMELNVQQNFLDPVYQLLQKDLKEISHHRKKLQSRRLDYDYKKGKGQKADEELTMAEEKFEESKDLCFNSMMNFMESDVEHIGQLHSFSESIRDYHRQCLNVMENLTEVLSSKLSEAASQDKPERSFISRPKKDTDSLDSYEMVNNDSSRVSAPSAPRRIEPPGITPPAPAPVSQPSARALYDFDPENEGELEFREGDVIQLTSRIDENWLEGRIHGKDGFFPENYVEIIVPL